MHFQTFTFILFYNLINAQRNNNDVCPSDDNWKPIEYNYVYYRKPHCLDENLMYVLQYCNSQTTTGYTKANKNINCFKYQEEINYCPDHLTSTDAFCYKLFPPGNFDEYECLLNSKEFSLDYLNLLEETETVWYPGRRRVKFGQFLHTEFSKKYATAIEMNVNKVPNNFSENDCVAALKNGTLEPVLCTSNHSRICVYDFLHKDQNAVCKKINEYDQVYCMNAHFEHDLTCICGKNMLKDCDLAAPLLPYQNGITNIIENCKVALEIDDKGVVKWKNINEKINYSYWSESYVSEFLKPNEIVVLSPDGWSLPRMNTANCNICNQTIELPFKFPKIHLILNDNNNLILESDITGLYGFEGHETIFCLTNGKPDSTITTFEIVYDFTESYNIKVQDSGHYWCEAFYLVDLKKVQTNYVLVELHNIYVIEIVYKYEEGDDPTSANVAYNKMIHRTMAQYNEKFDGNVIMKWMKTTQIDELNQHCKYLIHICTDLQSNHLENFNLINNTFIEFARKLYFVNNTSELYSSKYCFATETVTSDYILHWNTTYINEETEANEICLNYYGFPVRRKCLYDFITGAKWDQVENCCGFSNTTSNYTIELNGILNSNESTEEVIIHLNEITKHSEHFEVVDMYMISSILMNVVATNVSLNELCSAINNIILAKPLVLKESQLKMNSTDRILDALDYILQANKWKVDDTLFITQSLKVFIFDAKTDMYRGLAFIDNQPTKLFKNISFEQTINIPLLDIAAIIPDEILNLISKLPDSRIIIAAHCLDTLFNDPTNTSDSKVFGILIPGNEDLHKNVTLIYKMERANSKIYCSYWDYGQNKGSWNKEKLATGLNDNLISCEYSHTTHFGLLIATRCLIANTIALDVLTGIGAVLSIIGILIVFLTGILFPSWRRHHSNQLLLHYSLISLIQIIILYLSEIIKATQWIAGCITVGVFLHYTVLAQFSWMLLLAMLQYRRHVIVLYTTKKDLLIKLYLFGYIFPACPVFVVLIFFPDNYNNSNIGLCYPSGNAFNFAVLMPVILIFLVNVVIFSRIIYELFCKNSNQIESNDVLLRIRLAFLMFFILGITWLFGFLTLLFDSTALLYLFDITVSLQGFVIFLFFIALNKNTRTMYFYEWNKYTFRR